MKRRNFLQMGLAAMTAVTLPHFSLNDADAAVNTKPIDVSLRRTELLDADWRFKVEDVVTLPTPVTDWVWTLGAPDLAQQMTAVDLDTSGPNWSKTTPGVRVLPSNGTGWFRATLPDVAGPGRTIHFEQIDFAGTIYLNGKLLVNHEGAHQPLDAELDSAWNDGGPNVLAVSIGPWGGQGGLVGSVTIGAADPHTAYSSPTFDDTTWRTVHLPHDYLVEGALSEQSDRDHGSLPKPAAWYRRHFSLPNSDRGKSVWLYFEGIYRNAAIYLNGNQVYFQDDGYDSFYFDIADSVTYGAENVLAVHVDPRNDEGWFYEGGGIYRHVWLNIADPVHVVPWGVYVTSIVNSPQESPSADLTIKTELTNASPSERSITVRTSIIDPNGNQTASAASSHIIAANADLTVMQTAHIASAELWSLNRPQLYHSVTSVSIGGKSIDGFIQKFGIRSIRFDPDHGFFLNEQAVKINGTCNHQDFAGVGIGLPDSLLYWRMQTLKERLGCNAIRCSHNPMSPALYDACDQLGMLVMDEIRHSGDADEVNATIFSTFKHTDHIERWIRRDRSHPSVIMWSIGNEERGVENTSFGAEMMTTVSNVIRAHDDTRPVTAAVPEGQGNAWLIGFGSTEDLLGVNYSYDVYDWLHAQYPEKGIFGSETGSDWSCRGIYQNLNADRHVGSYISPENHWQPLGSREFVGGGFVWTGFDYRGESHWPEVNAGYGLLDLCGYPKDIAYYYRAWWNQDQPLVHIFPHWTWPGKEGQSISVWCFSNCDHVELFVNNVSQGGQDLKKFGHLQWDNVIYQPGAVKAIGYKGGQVVATSIVQTTGAPAAVTLKAGRKLLEADGEDTLPVEVSVVDDQGRVVPNAGNLITFAIVGAGVIAGVGNGDSFSHEPSQATSRSAFNGLALALVKASTKPGRITLTASAGGLTTATIELNVV